MSDQQVELNVAVVYNGHKDSRNFEFDKTKIRFGRKRTDNDPNITRNGSAILFDTTNYVSRTQGLLVRLGNKWIYYSGGSNKFWINRHLKPNKKRIDVGPGDVINIPIDKKDGDFKEDGDRFEITLKSLPELTLRTSPRKISHHLNSDVENLLIKSALLKQEDLVEGAFEDAWVKSGHKFEESRLLNKDNLGSVLAEEIKGGIRLLEEAATNPINYSTLGKALGKLVGVLEFGFLTNENPELYKILEHSEFQGSLHRLLNRLENLLRTNSNLTGTTLRSILTSAFQEAGSSYKYDDHHDNTKIKVLYAFSHVLRTKLKRRSFLPSRSSPRSIRKAIEHIIHDKFKEKKELFSQLEESFQHSWIEQKRNIATASKIDSTAFSSAVTRAVSSAGVAITQVRDNLISIEKVGEEEIDGLGYFMGRMAAALEYGIILENDMQNFPKMLNDRDFRRDIHSILMQTRDKLKETVYFTYHLNEVLRHVFRDIEESLIKNDMLTEHSEHHGRLYLFADFIHTLT